VKAFTLTHTERHTDRQTDRYAEGITEPYSRVVKKLHISFFIICVPDDLERFFSPFHLEWVLFVSALLPFSNLIDIRTARSLQDFIINENYVCRPFVRDMLNVVSIQFFRRFFYVRYRLVI